MLEIVHDMVPGAKLYFHDAGSNTVAFNAAIDELQANGCTVICDDVNWMNEPFFEDGIVASHVSPLLLIPTNPLSMFPQPEIVRQGIIRGISHLMQVMA